MHGPGGDRSCSFVLNIYVTDGSNRVYSIPLALDTDRTLCLALGRASRRVLEDNQIKNWLAEHRQTITDVFGDDYPYIRKRLDLGKKIIVLRIMNFR